jgi:predicted  nucleic acid-binding Zn-ribbon protein
MQEALAQAAPMPWSWQMTSAASPEGPADVQIPMMGEARARTEMSATTRPASAWTRVRSVWSAAIVAWALAFWLVLGIGWGVARRAGIVPTWTRRAFAARPPAIPSGIQLIDQLVWRAFEQQGYQLVREEEIRRPRGTLRIVAKDGERAALLCVGQGSFFEKHTVEEFMAAMRHAETTQGFLVGSGAFTVPAQRVAREHQISLIGREQLVQLLTLGAASEHASRQLQELRQQAAELDGAVRRMTQELDAMRRQRNEASWYLGEERAKTGALDAKIQALEAELTSVQASASAWEQQAAVVRRQWEENEWYLGEARSRAKYLEEQLPGLQEAGRQLADAQQQRDEANWYLEEERGRRKAFEEELEQLQVRLAELSAGGQTLQASCAWLRQELRAVRVFGERREAVRGRVPGIAEYAVGEEPLGAARIRDISVGGIGLDTEQEIPGQTAIRIRLRLPGLEEMVEADAELMWQRPSDGQPAFSSGCRLHGLTDEARRCLEQLVEAG